MIKPIRLSSGQKIYTHSADACAGSACCIHNPSDHHMREWKQWWEDSIKFMHRVCPHGLRHPDPDHVAYMLRLFRPVGGFRFEHGCDGCCRPVFIVEGEVVAQWPEETVNLLPSSGETVCPPKNTDVSQRA